MDTSTVYSKTAKGMGEFRSGGKNLAREHARVLALINGTASVRKLIDSGALVEGKYAPVLAALVEHGLIRVFEHDRNDADTIAFTPSSSLDGSDFPEALPTLTVEELSPQESVQVWAAARRGASELRSSGFYSYGTKTGSSRAGGEVGRKALVVEDDEELAQLLVLLLTEKGMLVQVAGDVPAALAIVNDGAPPDLVLLDIGLPGMPGQDGFDILGVIRRKEEWARVPVVMVTAEVSDQQVMKGLKAGADGYMFKPFKWDALYGCIKEVVGI
ncbi:response regulator [Massilia sp. TWP1-3-3]|uniref:response regulator n=1 Tax=Massilia sp. TWP1-3-3 TaxID=2804573 RepID=UPI003CED25B5